MVKKIESYNASYPAEYYEIGEVYAFYARGIKGPTASDKNVKSFSAVLKRLEEQENSNAIQPVRVSIDSPPKTKGGLSRHYAVVVDKDNSKIEVMFLNKVNSSESFFTKKYAVNNSAITDGKDLMPPSSHTNFFDTKGTESKVGGITKVNKSEKVGGITRLGNVSASNTGIGGITRANKTEAANNSSKGRVGGITRLRK